jgi:4-amino-4-deoxy-L-arabinose transferase-like glycosyltransferase
MTTRPEAADRLRDWLRAHALLVFFVYGAVLAACAFCLARPVLLVNDGHMYMEMARSMRHGSLEVDNGLGLIDSPELWLRHTVKRGLHLYAKYPPFYGLLAALPYAWIGIRGMYLLNAISLALVVPAVYLLARRILGPRRAFAASALFPLVVPVFPYALIELPHLVSVAFVLWAVILWDGSLRAPSGARASWMGAAAGLLAGVATAVRLQVLILAATLLAIGWTHARERRSRSRPALVSFALALATCLLAVAAFNVVRFGSANPFSYGASSDVSVGHPIDEETAGYFLRPGFLLTTGLPLGLLAAGPRLRRRPWLWVLTAAAVSALLLVPSFRAEAGRMGATAASLLINASIAGDGWSAPFWTFDCMSKAFLASTPFLVLGMLGAITTCARPARRLPTALAWMALLTVAFLSARDPDPQSGRGAMVFLSLSPRYLVEVTPGLYLLACRQLRDVRVRPVHWAVFAGAAAAFFAYMWVTGPDELAPFKQRVIASGSIGLAALVVAAFSVRRLALGVVVFPVLAAIANGYGTACAFAEDARCVVRRAVTHEFWGKRVLEAIPERAAIVGWRFGKDGILHLRSERDLLIVEPWPDGGASLLRTLDALEAGGIAAYYFGVELERVLPLIEHRYRAVPLLADPLLWRLDPIDREGRPARGS